jgi:hypothetical protein
MLPANLLLTQMAFKAMPPQQTPIPQSGYSSSARTNKGSVLSKLEERSMLSAD